jgi:hypothetical protein
MTSEAIPPAIFIRDYTRELHNRNAAVFAGAGLSAGSGYVDWPKLLEEITRDLGLDPKHERDLVTIAQYHCNQAAGNKHKLTQAIFDHFAPSKVPTENHRLLASLPISTYWTTNYDKLIEKSLEEAKRVPDVKYTIHQLPVTRPDRDAVVYKMHGDIDHPGQAVISKDDYESYPLAMAPFVSALRGDLVEKTFLFVGFSFTDPNIDYILSRVRVQYDKHQRQHFCIQRLVSQEHDETEQAFTHRRLKQEYFIKDLKRFGIQTVLVKDYVDITALLKEVAANYRRSSIFLSGAAEEYAPWDAIVAQTFVYRLAKRLSAARNQLITGFGVGIGSAVINGVLAHLADVGKTISENDLVMRPFPQIALGSALLSEEWTRYRREMIAHAGIAIFLFGNKRSGGSIVPSTGMREEFDLCVAAGVKPVPIGATGYVASTLWQEVKDQFATHFPTATPSFSAAFAVLGDSAATAESLIDATFTVVQEIQRA